MRLFVPFVVLGAFTIPVFGQQDTPNHSVPIYRVTVVQRSLEAVNFERHSGPTEIDLKGTLLLPKTEGKAIIQVKNGYTKIDLNLKRLEPPTRFGAEFLTYVLWAITPAGRAINLGEVIPGGSDKASMEVTSPESTFGLLLTAEPYFSVQYPSDVVVVESSVRPDTVGRVEEVKANYELMPRGQYTLNVQAAQLASATMKTKPGVSMEEYEAVVKLYQARNALQIARADGAGQGLDKAQMHLSQAESFYAGKNFKGTIDSARQAVQAASDARSVAVRGKAQSQKP
jgi:hypothetical protein